MVITGGKGGGVDENVAYVAMATVSVYGLQGWQEDLQPLIVARYLHACSSFISEGNRVTMDKK